MTVKMFITESKQIINNGKMNSQSMSADIDGKEANIMVSKNGNKQYAKLDKKDIHEILSLRSNKNNLLESLKKELKTKSNNHASGPKKKTRTTKTKRKTKRKPTRKPTRKSTRKPKRKPTRKPKRKTRKTKKKSKSKIENLLSDLF